MASKKGKPDKAAPKKAANGKSPKAAAKKNAPDDELDDEIQIEVEVELDDDVEVEPDIDGDDIDPEDLEEEVFEDEADVFEEEADDFEEDAEDESVPVARRAADDEDDDDLTTPDDVEADLDTILKDRLVAAEDVPNEDDEEQEVDERSSDGEALQPRRADEEMCTSCFLLVRRAAPNCPVGDDDCPIFSR